MLPHTVHVRAMCLCPWSYSRSLHRSHTSVVRWSPSHCTDDRVPRHCSFISVAMTVTRLYDMCRGCTGFRSAYNQPNWYLCQEAVHCNKTKHPSLMLSCNILLHKYFQSVVIIVLNTYRFLITADQWSSVYHSRVIDDGEIIASTIMLSIAYKKKKLGQMRNVPLTVCRRIHAWVMSASHRWTRENKSLEESERVCVLCFLK